MKSSFVSFAAPFVATAAAGLFAFSAPAAHAQSESKNIVEVAASNPNLSTLVKAIKAAGLADTLSGPGPFTVFAPTNAAFAKVPKAKLNALLADKAMLTKVLTYHVLPAKIEAATVVGMKGPANQKTVEGATVKVSPNPPMVNMSKITKTDIQASNGVIHLIDTVLMPPMSKMAPKMAPMKTTSPTKM